MENSELDKIFPSKEVAMFFVSWVRNGMNATRAYKELHPEVSEGSARVLGSRMLAKVNISDILAVYGLTMEEYFLILKEGLKSPDLKVRKQYHEVLGKLIGIEKSYSQKEPEKNDYFFKTPQDVVEAMKIRERELEKETSSS